MDNSNHSGASLSPGPPATEENIKVFLRLRPKNKLEAMKRSKDCIRFHENPNDITVESPLLGEFKFSFDHVRETLIVCLDWRMTSGIFHSRHVADRSAFTFFPRFLTSFHRKKRCTENVYRVFRKDYFRGSM